MTNIAVLGLAYGDEGKGRIVHDFSPNYDWIIRFNGGANAGHTIYRDGVKYVHNLMPSFDWRSPRPKAFLASGMVIDLEQLHKEVKGLYDINPLYSERVYVDTDAFVVLPEHKQEDKANNGHIGSTNRGIGPAYKSKIGRCGTKIRDIILEKNTDIFTYIQEMEKMGVHFVTHLELDIDFNQSSLLFEGAQGVMLDINHGTYPYVSCSESTLAGVYACGFYYPIDKVYGVAKCYSTKVGEGPFPSEIFGTEAENLRQKGNEYGATTGRPRRIGWLDLPALTYACKKGGITDIIITKFDILNGLSEVPICVEYEKTPTSSYDFKNPQLKYIKISGWQDATNISELKPFISTIESKTNKPVSFISVGVNPKDLMSCIS
jgi:adenylosuccinate synthase